MDEMRETKNVDIVKHVSTAESDIEFDRKSTERRLIRKLDLRVVPILCLLFLISFMDRGNIGNAHIQGMDKSLHLVHNDYNIAVMVFNLTYFVFGLPTTIIFKKTGPKLLPCLMFAWGICVIGQGLTRSFGGLVACRLLMGAFEAGFVPCCAFLFGCYYTKAEFLKRYAVFFSASIISGAFNGLFAYALSKMNGIGGYEGWRWIFIIEGLITIFVSVFAFFVILPFPEDCTSFTPEENKILLMRIEEDGATVVNDELRIWDYLKDYKIWLATLAYLGAEENASSSVAFQPAIIKGIGYTATAAQVHSIPTYVVAFVFSLVCAYFSERLQQRYVFAIVGVVVTVVGLAIEIAQPAKHGIRYLGMFFMNTGPYITMPIIVVWLALNVGKGYKRTVALGTMIPLGNCGTFVSSNVFITEEAPTYPTGFKVGLGFICLSAAASTVLYILLRLENKRRDRALTLQEQSQHSLEDLGENHPDFRYRL